MAKAKLKQNPIRKETQLSESLSITQDIIAQRAYALYLARGCEDGHDLDDWLRAERELREARICPPQNRRSLN